MTLGEKLASIQNIIHDFARTQLKAAGLDATLSEIVMGNVHRSFLEAAYEASLFGKVQSEMEPPQVEHRSATVEEFKKEMGLNDGLSGEAGKTV